LPIATEGERREPEPNTRHMKETDMKLRSLNWETRDSDSERVARKVAKMERRWADDHQALLAQVRSQKEDMLASGIDEATAENIANWKLDRAMALEAAQKMEDKKAARAKAAAASRQAERAIGSAWTDQFRRINL